MPCPASSHLPPPPADALAMLRAQGTHGPSPQHPHPSLSSLGILSCPFVRRSPLRHSAARTPGPTPHSPLVPQPSNLGAGLKDPSVGLRDPWPQWRSPNNAPFSPSPFPSRASMRLQGLGLHMGLHTASVLHLCLLGGARAKSSLGLPPPLHPTAGCQEKRGVRGAGGSQTTEQLALLPWQPPLSRAGPTVTAGSRKRLHSQGESGSPADSARLVGHLTSGLLCTHSCFLTQFTSCQFSSPRWRTS